MEKIVTGPVPVGDYCPCCTDIVGKREAGQHQPQTLSYSCRKCGHKWAEDWCTTTTSECPECGTSNNKPYEVKEW